jgi:hypothetical protein
MTSFFAGGSGWNVTVYAPTSRGNFLDFPWDPSTRQVVSNGVVPALYYHDNFAAAFPGTPVNDFALVASGNIAVAAGSYQFCTTSNNGSWLFVDGVLLVYNQGLHATATACQSIQLSEGIHTTTVNYFKQQFNRTVSGATLEVSMNGSLIILQINGKAPNRQFSVFGGLWPTCGCRLKCVTY